MRSDHFAIGHAAVAACALVTALTIRPPGAGAAIPTSGCGTITSDTLWTADNLYVLDGCDATIEAGARLTIEPGTVIKSGFEDGLTVLGVLSAQGTSARPIIFTSLTDDTHGGDTNGDGPSQGDRGDWAALTVGAGGRASISHAEISYGGGNYYFWDTKANLRCFDGQALLEDVTLRESAVSALYAEHCTLDFINGTVEANGSAGLRLIGLPRDSPVRIEGNTFAAPPGSVINFDGDPHGPVTIRNNASPGGPPGFSLAGTLNGELDWDNPALVLLPGQPFTVAPGATLHLAPGSIIKSFVDAAGQGLSVRGVLFAEGTSAQPIVFTSLADDEHGGDTNNDGPSTGSPGDWGGITVEEGGSALIRHGELVYGGCCGGFSRTGTEANLRDYGGEAVLEDVRLHESGGFGIYGDNGSLLIRDGWIADNVDGINNYTPSVVIDARDNWWGDASGPYHGTKNPGGQSNGVSDGVLFFPWAIDENGTLPSQVTASGPSRVSPGETVDYAISYYAGQDLQDAVLVVSIPSRSTYESATGDARYWGERREVFWKLGHLSAGSEGTVSVDVRYAWGIPGGVSDGVLAYLGAANDPHSPISVAPYLAYDPPSILAQSNLDYDSFQAALGADAAMKALYDQATSDGLAAVGASRMEMSDGMTITRAVLVDANEQAVMILWRRGDVVQASIFAPDSYVIRVPGGEMKFDFQTQTIHWSGTMAGSPALQAAARAQDSRFWECVTLCMIPKALMWTSTRFYPVLRFVYLGRNALKCLYSFYQCTREGGTLEACRKALFQCSKAATGVLRQFTTPVGLREFVGLSECLSDCLHDPFSHVRSEAVDPGCLPPPDSGGPPWNPHPVYKRRFEAASTDLFSGGDLVATGSWPDGALTPAWELSACTGEVPRCLLGSGCAACESGTPACATVQTSVRVAHDPNAKTGPAGELVPGQEVVYTVEYENVGQGTAFGVYVTDELSPSLDASTLDLGGAGDFFAVTRSITWEIGELAPHGEPGSKGERTFRVRVKSDLPGGTVITNQAVVHFPSVPEETPTNTVVNVVQPLVAIPQSLETAYGQPLAITLAGRDVSDVPLSYTIQQPPLNGELEGTPPNLTYTPAENFTGQDRFTFAVDNQTSQSRPAEVVILVTPSPNDTIAPAVLWTSPGDGETIDNPPAEALYEDRNGPVYAPQIQIRFSEALDSTTVTNDTFWVTSRAARPPTVSIGYDAASDRVVLVPRGPWRIGTYTVTATTGVQDASGNPLAADYEWSFRIGGGSPPCAGDCDENGHVTVDELVKGVNIALGTAALDVCPAFDPGGDGQVTVDELIQGVNTALTGCAAEPVATGTPTATRPIGQRTPTPPAIPDIRAGAERGSSRSL